MKRLLFLGLVAGAALTAWYARRMLPWDGLDEGDELLDTGSWDTGLDRTSW